MNFLKLGITMLTITLLLIVNAIGSSLCEHTFEIHGKTDGEIGLLFFDVLLGGECGLKESFILSVEPDKSRVWTRSVDYYGTDSLNTVLNSLSLEKELSLRNSNGRYLLNDSAFVTFPVNDSTFQNKLFRLCYDGPCDAKQWNRECPVNCKDLPQFSGVSANLIYTYPGGIYKNYTFTEVIYFPESSYLVIVVNQPLKSNGEDTNHGLLVFHLQ